MKWLIRILALMGLVRWDRQRLAPPPAASDQVGDGPYRSDEKPAPPTVIDALRRSIDGKRKKLRAMERACISEMIDDPDIFILSGWPAKIGGARETLRCMEEALAELESFDE